MSVVRVEVWWRGRWECGGGECGSAVEERVGVWLRGGCVCWRECVCGGGGGRNKKQIKIMPKKSGKAKKKARRQVVREGKKTSSKRRQEDK